MDKRKTVAVLETMWSWCGSEEAATPYFSISEENHTGGRLYWFLGHHQLLVTNACPQLAESANHHGKPDSVWLKKNLEYLQKEFKQTLLLVCGSVAQKTFMQVNLSLINDERVIFMPHPAARMWTREALDETRRLIQHDDRSLMLRFSSVNRIVATDLTMVDA